MPCAYSKENFFSVDGVPSSSFLEIEKRGVMLEGVDDLDEEGVGMMHERSFPNSADNDLLVCAPLEMLLLFLESARVSEEGEPLLRLVKVEREEEMVTLPSFLALRLVALVKETLFC